MSHLIIHTPQNQVYENQKKSFEETYNSGIARGYAIYKKIFSKISPGDRVIIICKEKECRAEGVLVDAEPALKKDGRQWITDNNIRRYNLIVKNLKMVPYRSEKLNRCGIAYN